MNEIIISIVESGNRTRNPATKSTAPPKHHLDSKSMRHALGICSQIARRWVFSAFISNQSGKTFSVTYWPSPANAFSSVTCSQRFNKALYECYVLFCCWLQHSKKTAKCHVLIGTVSSWASTVFWRREGGIPNGGISYTNNNNNKWGIKHQCKKISITINYAPEDLSK